MSGVARSSVFHQRVSTLSRRAVLLGAPALLAACSTKPVVFDDEATVRAVAYTHPGPKYLAVMTSYNVGTDNGAHTALIINASQRVIFDPAGDFKHSRIPEQHDVLYGGTPAMVRGFVDCHTRQTFWTSVHTKTVSAQSAERAFAMARSMGPQPDGACTTSTSSILEKLPEFQGYVKRVFFPNKLADLLDNVPGIERENFYQDDDPDKDTCARGLAL